MPSTCYLNSAPEQVAVTVNQTIIELDGDAFLAPQERFKLGMAPPSAIYDNGTGAYRYFSLQYVPIRVTSVTLFRNSGQQRYGVDYYISGKEIQLTTEATADDDFTCTYLTTGQTTVTSAAVADAGFVTEFEYNSISEVPVGWLALESGVTYLRATYPDLAGPAGFLTTTPGAAYLETAMTATHFELATILGTAYRNGVLVSNKKIIKHTT